MTFIGLVVSLSSAWATKNIEKVEKKVNFTHV